MVTMLCMPLGLAVAQARQGGTKARSTAGSEGTEKGRRLADCPRSLHLGGFLALKVQLRKEQNFKSHETSQPPVVCGSAVL